MIRHSSFVILPNLIHDPPRHLDPFPHRSPIPFDCLDVFERDIDMAAAAGGEIPPKDPSDAVGVESVAHHVGRAGTVAQDVVAADLLGTLRGVGEGRDGDATQVGNLPQDANLRVRSSQQP